MIRKRAGEAAPTVPLLGVGNDPNDPTDPGTPKETNDPAGGAASNTATQTGVGAGASGVSKTAGSTVRSSALLNAPLKLIPF